MKSLGLNVLSRVFVLLSQLVTVKLYTIFLSPGEIGFFYFLYTCSYFLNSILFVPYDFYYQSKVVEFYDKNKSIYPYMILTLKLSLIVLFVCLFSFFVLFYIKKGLSYNFFYCFSLSIFVFLNQHSRNTLNNCGYGISVSLSYFIESVLKVFILYLLYLYGVSGFTLPIFAIIICSITVFLYLLLCQYKIGMFKKKKLVLSDGFSSIILFSYPYSFGSMTNWIQLQGYRLVLTPLGYSDLVGFISVLTNMGAAAANAFSLIYNQQYLPSLYSEKGTNIKAFMLRAIKYIVLLLLFFSPILKWAIEVVSSSIFSDKWFLFYLGFFVDIAHLFISSISISMSFKYSTSRLLPFSLLGALLAIILFGGFVFFGIINVFTISFSLLFPQFSVVFLLFWFFVRNEADLK